MIVEYIRYAIPTPQREAFENAYGVAQSQLRLSPECTGFELSRCVEEPDQYVLRITWTSAEGHLKGFRQGPHFPPFLAQIRPFIDHIQEMRHYQPLDVSSATTIAETAGGLPAFERHAERMHQKMSTDDLLGSWFGNASPSHVPALSKWLTEVFGGPPVYTETYGDIGPMLARHANLNIPEDKRARFEALAAEAAAETWQDRPDVVRAISRYVAWGTTIAVENSLPGHVADSAAGVPTWGWHDE